MKFFVKIICALIFFQFQIKNIFAQRIYTNTSFRTISSEKYFRFHYDNDFFTKTDEYYTQGITLDYVHPSLKKNPLSTLLWKPFKATTQYGITFNLFGYTPTSILSDSILYGDRPFNANVSIKSFSIQIDAEKKRQLSSSLSIGVMGPAAKGYEIQYNIHKWLANPLPHGWQYQIKNDVILNYQLNYEKQLYASKNNFLLNGIAEARVGTLNNSLASGFNLMAGIFNQRYAPVNKTKRKAEYYFYLQNKVNVIAYDASQQGGLFNRNSPYIIASKDITRFTYQADAGIIINFKRIYLSYTQSFLTKEFATGTSHRWGGFSVGAGL